MVVAVAGGSGGTAHSPDTQMLKSGQFPFKEFWGVRKGFLLFLNEIYQEKT